MRNYLVFLAVSYLFSWLLVSLFQIVGTRYRLFKEHDKLYPHRQKDLPLLGGAPLYFGFVLSVLLFFLWEPEQPELAISLGGNCLLAITMGAAIICILGLIDDLYAVPIAIRISVQILAAVLLVVAQIRTDLFFLKIGTVPVGQFSLEVGNSLVTILWVLLIINLPALLEKFEGLMTGMGIIIGIFLFMLAIFEHDYGNAFLCLIFVGTLLGILWDELPPAKISLGKMGSGFIGFMLAALTLNLHYTSHTMAAAIPVVLLLIPLEVGLILLVRRLAGKPIVGQQIWETLQKKDIHLNNVLSASFLITTLLGFISLLIYYLASARFSWAVCIFLGLCCLFATVKAARYEFS